MWDKYELDTLRQILAKLKSFIQWPVGISTTSGIFKPIHNFWIFQENSLLFLLEHPEF